jgi:hypothetical protein
MDDTGEIKKNITVSETGDNSYVGCENYEELELIGLSQTQSTKESTGTDVISGLTNPFPITPKKPVSITVPRSSTRIKHQNLGIIGDLESPPCLATRSRISVEGDTVAPRASVTALASAKKRKQINGNAIDLLKKRVNQQLRKLIQTQKEKIPRMMFLIKKKSLF